MYTVAGMAPGIPTRQATWYLALLCQPGHDGSLYPNTKTQGGVAAVETSSVRREVENRIWIGYNGTCGF